MIAEGGSSGAVAPDPTFCFNDDTMFATYVTQNPQATERLGHELAKRLRPGDTVLLFGDLGAGKTTFVKGMAEELGIEMTIKSPTFAYVNHYAAKKAPVYHYDLYRLNPGDDLTSLGFEETINDDTVINLVEWADRLEGNYPERFIRVDFKIEGNYRGINIEFVDPRVVPMEAVESYYEKWATPMHVQEHCKAVASVAMQVAEAQVKQGQVINLDLVETAGLLHDMARVCDFKDLDTSYFSEEITDEKMKRWEELRAEHAGRNHSDIANEALIADGYTETAEVIRLHISERFMTEPNAYDTMEKTLVMYGDKRAAHDKIVSIKDRFEDGRKRYAQFDNPETTAFYEDAEKALLELEKELFKDLEIEPKDVK